jgi:hypothetical protein
MRISAGPVAGDCSLRTDRLRVDVNGDVPAHKQPTGFFEQFVGQSEIVAGNGALRVEGVTSPVTSQAPAGSSRVVVLR